ncbi:MAG: GIY-YIG nuclease family protein [Rhodothermaceae bacterium]|nr:GIY-YIG nuclease family protein [Rhodothermaceae bacterium]MXX57556.1 GIY-YIG nuclease family protein [Rhodothermaceae bacterium]MYD18531.1 GIY-YIG nuclease family protein [Rhodothermaceae bacterium]MYD57857.1 GIY-YIG nuclease family protein [Rhodothermaceae bacterium]MYI43290.1 GIY-YIG nuclease family protein [Rhodothermaceae bacterium]
MKNPLAEILKYTHIEEWSSVLAIDGFDKRRREYKRLGWLYAARNPSFVDSVYKIGQTTVSPSKRVEQLSSSTSVYRKFELAYFVHVSDHRAAEDFVHRALSDCRLNLGKEFFQASIMAVVKTLDEAGRRWPIPLGKSPSAGVLPPALDKRVVACPTCNMESKVPKVLVDISVTCTHCANSFKVP